MDRQASQHALAPFRIEPMFVERIWGFRDLRPWYDRVADHEPIGEVWLTGDDCIISTGPHAGTKLGDIFVQAQAALMGERARTTGSPLLVKLLFAREKLSVQVHPDDAMAQKYGAPNGKAECWYTLAAEPGAQVAVGFKPGTSLQEVQEEIHAGTLESSLTMLPVAAGEMVYVDAGTVHAIWPGSILLETQQNCDLTYRMFDYGRDRELHIEKSLEAARLTTSAGKIAARALADRTILIDVKYFRVERIPVAGMRASTSLRGKESKAAEFAFLFAAAGAGRITSKGIETLDLPARGVVAVPASSPEFEVVDLGGLDLIRITLGQPKERDMGAGTPS